jgi:LysM repeat protein
MPGGFTGDRWVLVILHLERTRHRNFLHVAAGAVVVASLVLGGGQIRKVGLDVQPGMSVSPPLGVPDAADGGIGLLPMPDPNISLDDGNMGNPAAPSEPDAQLNIRTYTVEDGDSVRTIAQQFGVTNETIIWENDLTDPDVLQVGQELRILPFSGLIHEVHPGDTVASVANFYDALVQDVISANKLSDPDVIVVGQKLAVPGGYRPLPQDVVQGDGSDQMAATVGSHQLPVLGNTPQEQFISSIARAAVNSADQTGVPASVTIAQAILESYWGSSRLATDANNYFGIKAQPQGGTAGSVNFNVWEVIGGRNVFENQAFRAYNSVADSFVDHGLFFLQNSRYAGAMAVKGDARQFAVAINREGYATDPSYSSKLIGLMDRYNLYRYDDV